MLARLSLLLIVAATAACGGRSLSHTIKDDQLVGLTGEVASKVNAARGEVSRSEDELRSFDVTLVDTKKQLESVSRQRDAAGDALSAANNRISSTRDSEADALKRARTERDERIAEARKAYEQDERTIRERYAAEQTDNQARLDEAKGLRELADLEKKYHEAMLKRNKTEKAMREQIVWLKRAQLERQKLEAYQGLKATKQLEDDKQRLAFEKQVLEEEQKLNRIQEKLQSEDADAKAIYSQLEQAQARYQREGLTSEE